MKLKNERHKFEVQSLDFMCNEDVIQLCVRYLSVLLMLALLLLHKNAYAASENILTKPRQWLENLSPEEQKIALVKYQIRLGEKANDVLLNAKSAKDRLWGSKIMLCGYDLVTHFSTKNKDLKDAAAFMAEGLSDAIAGQGTAEIRKSKIDKAFSENRRIANSISNEAAALFDKRHASDSEEVNKTLTVAAMLCAPPDAITEEQSTCSPKGVDVCKIARKIASEMAPLLPMRLSSNLVVQTVFAVNRSIAITAKFEYGKSHLDDVLSSSGMSNDDMLKIMHKHARDGFCQPNTPNKSFIDLGGVVEYHYRFNDGSVYARQRIGSCL